MTTKLPCRKGIVPAILVLAWESSYSCRPGQSLNPGTCRFIAINGRRVSLYGTSRTEVERVRRSPCDIFVGKAVAGPAVPVVSRF